MIPDVDSVTEIFRRAQASGREVSTYNPDVLVQEVEALLRERGICTQRVSSSAATAGAGALLRALDVLPAGGVELIDRTNAPDEY